MPRLAVTNSLDPTWTVPKQEYTWNDSFYRLCRAHRQVALLCQYSAGSDENGVFCRPLQLQRAEACPFRGERQPLMINNV